MIRSLAEDLHFPPHVARELPLCDLLILLEPKGERAPGGGRRLSREEQLEIRNRQRAKKGLPPILPREFS